MSRVTLSDQTVSMAYLSSDFQKPLTSVHTVSLQTGTGMGLLSFTKVSPANLLDVLSGPQKHSWGWWAAAQ